MDEKNILTVGEGDEKTEYLIERVIRMDDKNFFTLFNLRNGDFMFGEFTGVLPKDDDEAIEVIGDDFRNGCLHISYPDGYIVDDLYEMIDFY